MVVVIYIKRYFSAFIANFKSNYSDQISVYIIYGIFYTIKTCKSTK